MWPLRGSNTNKAVNVEAVSPLLPTDIEVPGDADAAVVGDILLENARRFSARLGPSGFSNKINVGNGKRLMRIVGLGNPLLDVSASVAFNFFEEHNIQPNGACIYQPEHEGVFQFLRDCREATKVPGGSCLNTLRVVQWLTKTPRATTYLGTVGDDAYGEALRGEAQRDGLFFPLLLHPTLNTGTCAVLIAKHERSLIANLGASCHFSDTILESNGEVRAAILKADIFYCEGFVFNASPQSIFKLAHHAMTERKIFALNISACFVPGLHKTHWMRVLPFTHYLFGNGEEAISYGEVMGWTLDRRRASQLLTECGGNASDCDVTAVALRLSEEPLADPLRNRCVVLTQGARATIMACRGQVHLYNPPDIQDEEIVDTNGSGDAFVGGFLAHLSAGSSLNECVSCGHRAAKEMLKRSGCTLPEVCLKKV